jgi:hypothetical protein
MKNVILKSACILGLFAAPTFAQGELACDAETYDQIAIAAETAPAEKKDMAMAELDMAKEKMAEGDLAACSVHLNNAALASTIE